MVVVSVDSKKGSGSSSGCSGKWYIRVLVVVRVVIVVLVTVVAVAVAAIVSGGSISILINPGGGRSFVTFPTAPLAIIRCLELRPNLLRPPSPHYSAPNAPTANVQLLKN